DQLGMGVADVMNAVAMKIHVALAGDIFDPDTFGLGDRREAWRGKALVQERVGVTLDQLARCRMFLRGGPACSRVGSIGLTFGVDLHDIPLSFYAVRPSSSSAE